MAKPKALTKTDITKVEKLLDSLNLEVFRATTGELFTAIPAAGGVGRIVQPYHLDATADLIKWALYEQGVYNLPKGIRHVIGYRASKAEFSTPQPVSRRVAERWEGLPTDGLYYDLCNERFEAVWIAPGKRPVVTARHGINFLRPVGMMPVPVPNFAGSVLRLREILGITDQGTWILLLGWLGSVLREAGEHFILAILGRPGAGKSMLSRLLKLTIDPSDPELIDLDFKAESVLLSALNCLVPAFDEIDGLSKDKIKVLCGIATGTGRQVRGHYQNTDLSRAPVCRPVLLNGLGDLHGEERIRQRMVSIELPPRLPEQRQKKSDLLRALRTAHADILGGLFTLASAALGATETGVSRQDTLRMAEAGEFGELIVQAAGYAPGSFLKEVAAAQTVAAAETAAEWVGFGVIDALARKVFLGTPEQLYQEFSGHPHAAPKHPDWPKAANALRVYPGSQAAFCRGFRGYLKVA